MLEMIAIRNNAEEIKQRLAVKNFKELNLIDEALSLDEKRRAIQTKLDENLSKQNVIAKEIGDLFKQGKREEADKKKTETVELKESSKQFETDLAKTEEELKDILVRIPNTPHKSVPVGKTPEENEVVKSVGEIPRLHEGALPHWDLAKKYDLFDLELGVKITGAGFPVYKKQGAKLQRALISFFLDNAVDAGYMEVIPPHMVNEASAFATGQLPDKEGQMYVTKEEGFYLIPTAEVPVTNIVRDEILETLPTKFAAYSPCFRREAGSYGKDTKGFLRVHQFNKVELINFCQPEKSYDELEKMLQDACGILEKLQVYYRVIELCTADIGFAASKCYDIEVWSYAEDKWLEASSVSNCTDFQTRRAMVRYKKVLENNKTKTELVHALNGSGLATSRLMVALLEANQTENGNILIPDALKNYTGFEKI